MGRVPPLALYPGTLHSKARAGGWDLKSEAFRFVVKPPAGARKHHSRKNASVIAAVPKVSVLGFVSWAAENWEKRLSLVEGRCVFFPVEARRVETLAVFLCWLNLAWLVVTPVDQ